MPKKLSRFNRIIGTRSYRKVYNIFMEGTRTEPQYFEMLKEKDLPIHINLFPSQQKTQPIQVLKRAKNYIKNNALGKNEEAWLVVDIDDRMKNDFQPLLNWEQESKKHGVAISNPSFEYWLLLHFDKGNDVKNLKDCREKLKKHLPLFEKGNVSFQKIRFELIDLIKTAIANAKQRHQHCIDWHHDKHTTVYILIEKILA